MEMEAPCDGLLLISIAATLEKAFMHPRKQVPVSNSVRHFSLPSINFYGTIMLVTLTNMAEGGLGRTTYLPSGWGVRQICLSFFPRPLLPHLLGRFATPPRSHSCCEEMIVAALRSKD